jgi:hypothetical protein
LPKNNFRVRAALNGPDAPHGCFSGLILGSSIKPTAGVFYATGGFRFVARLASLNLCIWAFLMAWLGTGLRIEVQEGPLGLRPVEHA